MTGGPGPPSEDLIELDDVSAIAATPGILICRVGTHQFQIADMMVKGGDVRRPGDHGRLVIPRWLATNLGLVGPGPGSPN